MISVELIVLESGVIPSESAVVAALKLPYLRNLMSVVLFRGMSRTCPNNGWTNRGYARLRKGTER